MCSSESVGWSPYRIRKLVPPSFAANPKTPRGICLNPSIAMLFYQGEIVMRILSKREVKELVLYSLQHIARLEKAGLFPKRAWVGWNVKCWIGLKNDLRNAKC